jgi:transposase
VITIGIDPHKRSITAAAIDLHHYPHDHQRLRVDAHTTTRLLAWAARWPTRRWAVEGAAGLGHTIAQQLVAAGETVVDVPAALAARARLLGSGSRRKTDLADARSVATVALCHPRLCAVAAEDHLAVIRLLVDHRDDLAGERTRTVNRLHVLLRDLHPGGAKRSLSAAGAARLLGQLQPATQSTPTGSRSRACWWPMCAAWTLSSPPTRPRSARRSAPATPP